MSKVTINSSEVVSVKVFKGAQDVSSMGTAITANDFSKIENVQTAASTIKSDHSLLKDSMVLYDVSSSSEVTPVFRIAQNGIITTNGKISIIFTNGKTGEEIPLEIALTSEGAVVPEGLTMNMGDSGPPQLFYGGDHVTVMSGETYLCLDPTNPMMMYFVNNEVAYKIIQPTAIEPLLNEVGSIGIYNTPTGTITVEVGGRIEIH